MFPNFRLAMAWLHTWFGLVLGFVLMVCFFFGSLSVFDREIDRWSIPDTRFEPQPMPSFDRMLRPSFERMQPEKDSIALVPPPAGGLPERYDTVLEYGLYITHRDPVVGMWAGFEVPGLDPHEHSVWGSQAIDPRTGNTVSSDRLALGSRFFYPLHYDLHLHWKNLGMWIVGLAALVMLAALVSGVVMHRRIFREFFTFRPKKALGRSSLDLHNMTGVLALPFHFFFAFTGLLIFAGTYFPVTQTQLHDLHELHEKLEAKETGMAADRAGVAAPLASVDAMVAEAKRRWAARGIPGEVGFVAVRHVNDANSYVMVARMGTDRVVKLDGETVYFKGSTGEVIREAASARPVEGIAEFLTGLHLQHFKHWMLRWLYVLGGLLGCVCIATGFVLFVEKRKKQHAKKGRAGSRAVDALAVTTVTGMLIATFGLLVVNRWLPDAMPAGWPPRNDVEEYAFWAIWVAAMGHAFVRSKAVAQGRINPAWREQCWAAAGLAVAAVVSNAWSTGDHLVKTVFVDTYWPVAGVDLSLLVVALLAVVAARRIARRERGGVAVSKPDVNAMRQPALAKVSHG